MADFALLFIFFFDIKWIINTDKVLREVDVVKNVNGLKAILPLISMLFHPRGSTQSHFISKS